MAYLLKAIEKAFFFFFKMICKNLAQNTPRFFICSALVPFSHTKSNKGIEDLIRSSLNLTEVTNNGISLKVHRFRNRMKCIM